MKSRIFLWKTTDFPYTQPAENINIPSATSGFVLLMASVSFRILENSSIALEGRTSKVALALSSGRKEKLSTLAYLVGIGLSFLFVFISIAIFYLVAIFWIVPDKRVEKIIE